ncbi:peptidase S13 [Sphingobacterium alkalisoli]|uniref:Peptidase S13 n=1 Tax=Sphingobacterium alkalisoli TaxID=1874115 RepID=A0A4U0H6F4_9SPHI|nr:D-alanyl-D-alanine carboxypeptidase [Sphingobacterium alkalisoli]TJY65922.1 peptidase S13 [Sphingobacterium alkalisoli]GGH17477.1 peptidase M15 [Sphingobacterium alkalisoli]
MINFLKNVSLCLIGVLFPLSTVQAQNFDTLQELFKGSSVLNKHYYGFSLYDLDSNRFVYGNNEDKHFTPASNTKVFTLFASLKIIGDSIPGIEYIEKGDSLLFWGTGDPTFLHPILDSRRVYNFLKFSNKKLFYVSQQTAEPFYREGWSIEDYAYDYQPEIAVFPIYGNLVRFKALGKDIIAFPKLFNNKLTIREKYARHFNIIRDFHSNAFELTNVNPSASYRSSKPFHWSDSLFVNLLSDTLSVNIRLLSNYSKPSDTKTLYSVPRNVVLREMMLPSDNFLAEHLTMVAAKIKYREFQTDSLRVEMQDKFYKLFTDSIQLRDGSGLSTYNKVTPRSMVELLVSVKEIFPDYNQLFNYFPAGGIDGTLKTAYALDQGVPFVWAKTGTIHAVHCQSGYLVTRTGRRYAFSFLNNNFIGSATPVRKEMVRIMTFIRQNY